MIQTDTFCGEQAGGLMMDARRDGHPAAARTLAAREFGWWNRFWGWLVGLFLLFATTTNLLDGLFHFALLPVFANTLADFRQFTHWALDIFLFSWVKWLLAYAWLGITTLLSHVFIDIKPLLPEIVVPGWYKDLALISALLSRVKSRAIIVSQVTGESQKRLQREDSRTVLDEIRHAHSAHPILYAIARIAQVVQNLVLKPIHFIGNKVAAQIYRLSGSFGLARFVGYLISTPMEGVTMYGIIDFATDTTRFFLYRRVASRVESENRRLLGWIWFTFMLAILSSFAFFVCNGYALGVVH